MDTHGSATLALGSVDDGSLILAEVADVLGHGW
jgi:hypothetical protein